MSQLFGDWWSGLHWLELGGGVTDQGAVGSNPR